MATIPSFQHATPAYRTFCGPKALAALPRELDRLGARRAVIFGGPWLVALPDVLGAIESAVGQRLAGRFDDVQEHSPVPSVEVTQNDSSLGGVALSALVLFTVAKVKASSRLGQKFETHRIDLPLPR